MTLYVIVFVFGLAFGFVGGALVWRNNAKKSAMILEILLSSNSTTDKLKEIAKIFGVPFV